MTDQEINETVARKLGWKHAQCQDAPGLKTGKEWWFDLEGMPRDTPDFCHSIAAAWEITEQIPHCTLWHGGDWWMCSWAQTDGSNITPHVKADTAPMAIALCFLKLEDSK